jgi:exosortase B
MTASRDAPLPGRDRLPGLQALVPMGTDVVALCLGVATWAVMFVPTFVDISESVWASDEQGHGPIILCVAAWLIFRARQAVADAAGDPRPLLGALVFALGLVLYVFGRAQDIILFEVFAQIPVLAGLLLMLLGPGSLRVLWFPLFFLLFMVPLPSAIVSTLTTPLKSAVSYVAELLMYHGGYPIGRAGVALTVGPYQLLVADACAGLNSMFTLEALGLLYMNLLGHTSLRRNTLLAVLIVPISFLANVIRVMILILVTYHFGDEAGQGFVHSFAGMVLFMVGLVLILAVDAVLGRFKMLQSKKEPA